MGVVLYSTNIYPVGFLAMEDMQKFAPKKISHYTVASKYTVFLLNSEHKYKLSKILKQMILYIQYIYGAYCKNAKNFKKHANY